MMNKNVAIKQARLWQRELRHMARAENKHPDEMLEAMAVYLAEVDDIEVALNLAPQPVLKPFRKDFILSFLKGARDGRKQDAIG